MLPDLMCGCAKDLYRASDALGKKKLTKSTIG